MKLDLDTLGRNMKLLRLTNGFSQEELAERLFISRTAYMDYEKCTRAPDLQTLDALSRIYNISLDTLVFHDLSQGSLYRIYLNEDQRKLCALLSEYENLTASSKGVIMERIDTLLEREEIFYSKYMMQT
ncbi:MAG: helix-turn-helix domain-containing protein [Lentihominibacter sp.]